MARIDKLVDPCHRGDMNVSLTKDLERLVRRKLDSGLYASATEVVREGLRLLAERDRTRIRELNREISRGLQSARRGELVPGEQAIANLRRRIERRRRRKAP